MVVTPDSRPPPPAQANETLQLPDIHEHLPPGTDSDAGNALSALYRTHCTSVIDSFRFCKEKNLLRQFAALAGTLTVPVHKVFVHPSLASWIEQCDWLMYQKMLAFVVPLTTQVVPDPVLNAFASIARGLAGHIRATLRAHPQHVAAARLVPATVFCHLLRRFLDVNQAANAAAAWLCHVDNRAKMWEEYVALVDAEEIAVKARVPECSHSLAVEMIKQAPSLLLSPGLGAGQVPVPGPSTAPGPSDILQLEARAPNQLDQQDVEMGDGVAAGANVDQNACAQRDQDDAGLRPAATPPLPITLPDTPETPFPDKWVAFLQQVPALFADHPARCILATVEQSWEAILHRLTLGGAQSFSAWWMAKVFFVEMMAWQAEKAGFTHHTPPSLRRDLSARPSSSLQASGAATGAANGADDLAQGHTHPASLKTDTSQPVVIDGTSGQFDGSQTAAINGAPSTVAITTPPVPTVTDAATVANAAADHFVTTGGGNDDSAIDVDDDSMDAQPAAAVDNPLFGLAHGDVGVNLNMTVMGSLADIAERC
ncbi:hypothetical protein KEM52_006606 [Ascosphaera acerosa]|nr:hypothetical protein KEM52_006606 [Ascosphaera acerosa]